MEYLFFSTIKVLTGYRSIRSVKKFLLDLGVETYTIGKHRAVDKEAFERAIAKQNGKSIQPSYRPQLPAEKAFLADLQNFLTELPSHDQK